MLAPPLVNSQGVDLSREDFQIPKEVPMFGRMTATPLIRLDAGKSLDVAVAELLAATEYPQIARWIWQDGDSRLWRDFLPAAAPGCGQFYAVQQLP
jgi:hypothetical protein